MSEEFEQYAVYWVPKRNDALAQFGASWTGWCAEQGMPRPRSALHGLPINIPIVTRHLCRHGFHSVIKAPFRLRDGRSRFSVEHVIGRLAEDSAAFDLPQLQLEITQGCVALTSPRNYTALGNLIRRVDKAMAALELALPSDGGVLVQRPLSGRTASAFTDKVVQFPQANHHHFQIPLTDPLDPKTAQDVMDALQPLLEPALDQPRRLHDVALMGDPGSGRPLRVLEFYELLDLQRQYNSDALPVQGPDFLVPISGHPS